MIDLSLADTTRANVRCWHPESRADWPEDAQAHPPRVCGTNVHGTISYVYFLPDQLIAAGRGMDLPTARLRAYTDSLIAQLDSTVGPGERCPTDHQIYPWVVEDRRWKTRDATILLRAYHIADSPNASMEYEAVTGEARCGELFGLPITSM
ncbi:MAG TPA: hypothetical protein VFK13_11540 [Gemmatimonadaceae bacterium]|nr:hypothetical protein [Gemmatimonadaceae bacterium]